MLQLEKLIRFGNDENNFVKVRDK